MEPGVEVTRLESEAVAVVVLGSGRVVVAVVAETKDGPFLPR